MMDKKVLVIGGGVAGLSAASDLADLGIGVEIVEKSYFPGGHGIRYTCKATDQCVKCGACMVEEKLEQVVENPNIKLMAGTRVERIAGSGEFTATLVSKPVLIDTEKCNNCGLCFQKCPVEGAVLRGFSKNHTPFYAIAGEKCLYMQDGSCTICHDECPQDAIDLNAGEMTATTDADAIIVATGFSPFSPESKPYGYGVFKNVITNLEMEEILRRHGRTIRPTDGGNADRIAFVQCVGSRDAKLNHLWCSKVCCGSALRMAGLVNTRQPETEITFFYMDVQTFGRDFEDFYANIRKRVRMIRAIPGDIYPADGDRMRVTFVDSGTSETLQEEFDLVVLSVGLLPCRGTKDTADVLGLPLANTGFALETAQGAPDSKDGIFTAGTATGPMGIAEAIASAGKAAAEVMSYLKT